MAIIDRVNHVVRNLISIVCMKNNLAEIKLTLMISTHERIMLCLRILKDMKWSN